jgi:tetratricopeptide (TPR) repeat protein
MRARRSPMMRAEGRRSLALDERMNRTNQELSPSHAQAFAFASLLVVSLGFVLATTAHADPLAKPTNVVARDYLTTGNRFYRLREFEKAIEEYKAGAVREDSPIFYYNLGQCYRQLGRYEDAIWHYERFLERGKPTGEVEASVRDFIVQMRGELEKKAMKQPPIERERPVDRTRSG